MLYWLDLLTSESWTVLFWRGIFFAAGIFVILLITYRSKAVNELINIGKGGVLIGLLTALGGTSFYFGNSLHIYSQNTGYY